MRLMILLLRAFSIAFNLVKYSGILRFFVGLESVMSPVAFMLVSDLDCDIIMVVISNLIVAV